MNLSEALTAALPELPPTRLTSRFAPRLDPDLVVREDILDGQPSVSILQRYSSAFTRLTPQQWQLVQLFDGVRSYEEIAEAAETELGLTFSAEYLRSFADDAESCGFWYKTPQERNLAMREKLAAHRCRRQHGGNFTLAHISFSAWDPDRYLTALDNLVGRFVYNRWSTLFAVLLFVFEACVFFIKWNTFGPDVHRYYQFTEKSFADLLEFWVLFFFLGFLHETAHGLTCKHYGGQVHSMGFLLLYLTPAFYCDITEVWVTATRGQRLAAIIAGIWTELVVCGFATIVWTNTLPGAWQHDLSYKIMLLTGVAVVVLNVNPLLKLDGYYFLTEWIRVPDLKERSSGFVSAWVQRHIFSLPVDLPMVSANRVPLMVFYALASGLYSYLMLFSVIRLTFNIAGHWMAELAFLPAALLAFVMFRSRLRALRNFLLSWFRGRREAGHLRLRPMHAIAAVLLVAFLFVPLWRDREPAYFVIEPSQKAVLHASLPGRIISVAVHEGEWVRQGQVLARAASLDAAGTSGESHAALLASQEQLFGAELAHRGVGDALAAADAAARGSALAHEQRSRLTVVAPFSGTIVSPNPGSLLNQVTGPGQELLSIVDTAHLRVRLYLPEPEIARIHLGDEVALQIPSTFASFHCTLGTVDGRPTDLPPGVVEAQQFSGTKLAYFYNALIPISAGSSSAAHALELGMSGRAVVFGPRRSIAFRIGRLIADLTRTHLW